MMWPPLAFVTLQKTWDLTILLPPSTATLQLLSQLERSISAIPFPFPRRFFQFPNPLGLHLLASLSTGPLPSRAGSTDESLLEVRKAMEIIWGFRVTS